MTKDAITPVAIMHLMREASGESMMTCKKAWEMAEKELEGDYVLALLMLSANSLAVNVKDAPGSQPGQTRKEWNKRHAESVRQAHIDANPAYAKLAEMSQNAKG